MNQFFKSSDHKADQNSYSAAALSFDNKMGDDSVMFCYQNGVGMAWNPRGHSASVNLKDPLSGLTNTKSTFKDGILSCGFRRNKVTNIDIPNALSQNDCQTFDLR